MSDSESLRKARENLVREHIASENRHEFDATIKTFHHPRYEVFATGEVFDGEKAVSDFFQETHTAFPDFHAEPTAFYHADNAVLVEVSFLGTHTGFWRGLPPTYRPVTYSLVSNFLFEEDKLVCERLYFDLFTILRQVGIARDPTTLSGKIATFLNHPITTGTAFLRSFLKRGRH